MTKLAIHGGTPLRQKPFTPWPIWDDTEERALLAVLHSGKWWRFSYGVGLELREPEAGERSRVVEFQEAFARHHDARYGIACANGTAAIEILLKALGIGPGDEVVVPAFTFIATASAVLMVNAVPVFVDIHPDSYNIDPVRIEQAITPRTRAIIPVHFAGQPADMDAILAIARKRNLSVIEDAAHAHGCEWKGKKVGALGDGGTFSFQASKNMTAGEGGIILTNNRDVAELCESFLWAGRKIGRPWYEHYRLGWNYRLTEFQGAILLQQLKRLDAQNACRMENAAYLNARLAKVKGIRPFRLDPRVSRMSHHVYMLRYSPEEFGLPRQQFVQALVAEGIPAMAGYSHPLYKNPMFLNQEFYPRGCPINCGHYGQQVDFAAYEKLCPVSERACAYEAVWMEHRMLLGNREDMDDVVNAVEKIRDNLGEFAESRTAAKA